MNKNHVGKFCKKRVINETPERERITSENKKRRMNVVDINGVFFNEIPDENDVCEGCYFEYSTHCDEIPECSGKRREDGQSVIYKLWELKQ